MKQDKKLEDLKKDLREAQKEYDRAKEKFSRSKVGAEMTIAGAEWSVAGNKLSEATRLLVQYNNKHEEKNIKSDFNFEFFGKNFFNSFFRSSDTSNNNVFCGSNNSFNNVNINSKKIVSTTISNDNNCNNGHCVRTKTTTITYSDGTQSIVKETLR